MQEERVRRSLAAQAARELCRRDFHAYCQMVHGGRWRPGAHHALISRKLQAVAQGTLKRLMVWMPPRHGKSMQITQTFPSYFLGRFPEKRVIEVSYAAELASRFGRANRQKLEAHGQALFGVRVDRRRSSGEAWEIQAHAGGMRAVGLGGGITGEGADLLVVDDPIKNRAEAESETVRARIWDEYQSTLLTRLHPGAAVILVMTRWHEDDLCGKLLRSGEDWDVVRLPALSEGEGDLLKRPQGAPLWPEHGFDLPWAQARREAVGAYAWASLYQQRPAPAGGGVIRRGWWRVCAPEERPPMVHTVLSVDAAFKGGANSDTVAIHAWGKRGVDYYLLAREARQMDFVQTLHAIRRMYAALPDVQAVLIEDKANGPAVVDMLQHELPGVLAVTPRGGKLARAHAVAPLIESGHVFVPDDAGGQAVVDQCALFPSGRYDDDVDAMTQALTYLAQVQAEAYQPRPRAHWHPDQYEDYLRATDEQRTVLLQKWGDPF